MEGEGVLMSKSCKPLHPGLFLLGAATAVLVFAAPQTCAAALRQGLALCGGPLLVSLFPFLVVSALIMRSGAGEVLGVLLWPVVRCIGLRSRSAGSVLLIGLVGGFAPAAAATAEAVRSRELTPQEASALLPACICSGPSFVILTVGEQLLGSRTAGVCLFAAQVLAGWLTGRIRRESVGRLMDAIAFGAPLAIAVERIGEGCFDEIMGMGKGIETEWQVVLESLRNDSHMLLIHFVRVNQVGALVLAVAVIIRWTVTAVRGKTCTGKKAGLLWALIIISIGLGIGLEFAVDRLGEPLLSYGMMALALVLIAWCGLRFRRMANKV